MRLVSPDSGFLGLGGDLERGEKGENNPIDGLAGQTPPSLSNFLFFSFF